MLWRLAACCSPYRGKVEINQAVVFYCIVYVYVCILQHIAYRMGVIVAHKIIYSARRMHFSSRRVARVRTLLTILYVNIAMIIV